MKSKPVSLTVFPWLWANLGKTCTAGLTGTDTRALIAAVHVIELYSVDPIRAVAQAFGVIVSRMQPEFQPLAYHAIAHVMDWNHRAEIWALTGLDLPRHLPSCVNEPGGWNGWGNPTT